jgi:serine/threonine protein kinase
MGERIRIAIEAARGMQFLHEHHIIHRDLKSMNLLVMILISYFTNVSFWNFERKKDLILVSG